ncbi:MAG: alpha/beta fold hydrolase [Candidatus Promineofilum sp.]|nr:alpha/beta fold hydrolase [Promineifilum sp.]MBP9657722.1 alpha/beta fold hydrolase [Promineifilum sp.]
MPFKPNYEVKTERLPYTLASGKPLPDGRRVGVLVLHGFMGSPLSSRPMAEYLNQKGVFVHCPLLPGHGTYPSALRGAGRNLWLAEAEEAYRLVRQQCDELYLIGHSMGNILGAHIAVKYGDAQGIAMLAPVYNPPDKRLNWVKYIHHFVPWYYPHKSKKESMQHLVRERVLDFDPSVDYDSPEFQAQLPQVSRVPLSGMHEMVAMIEMGRKLWPRLDIPVRIFAGEDDNAAHPDNARQILSILPNRDKNLTVYPHVGHELMRPFEPIHATVWESVAAFILKSEG